MTLSTHDKLSIKYAICRRFGTVFAFEDARDLPRKSVSDFLRGRTNQRVSDEIDKILDTPEDGIGLSDKSDNNAETPAAHRLNSVGR